MIKTNYTITILITKYLELWNLRNIQNLRNEKDNFQVKCKRRTESCWITKGSQIFFLKNQFRNSLVAHQVKDLPLSLLWHRWNSLAWKLQQATGEAKKIISAHLRNIRDYTTVKKNQDQRKDIKSKYYDSYGVFPKDTKFYMKVTEFTSWQYASFFWSLKFPCYLSPNS